MRRRVNYIRCRRGEFLALGPAITRRPISVRIGEVKTGSKAVSPKLMPLPTAPAEDMRDMLFAPSAEDEAPPPPPPAPVPMADLMRAVATPAPAPVPDMPVILSTAERRFGGSRPLSGELTELLPYELVIFGEPGWFEED